MKRYLLITPKKIALTLSAIVIMILFAHIACVLMRHILGFTFHTMHIFDVNKEGNIPSVYSSLSILFCSRLLYLISNLPSERRNRQRLYWRLLMIVFAFLALDELVSIHETLTDNAKALLGTSADGVLYFAWVLPYVIVFGSIGIALIRFLLRLPPNTAIKFGTAGLLFVCGAVGFEMIGGSYVANYGDAGKTHLTYAFIVTAEELLEMVGVIVFVYALSDFYLKHAPAPIHVNLVIAEKGVGLKTPDTISSPLSKLPMVDESLN